MSEKETDIKLNAADALEFEPLPVRPSKLGQRLKTFFLVILSGATGALFWEYFGEDGSVWTWMTGTYKNGLKQE